MRYATLKPATPGRVEISVVVLRGDAGGELSNVNRWRDQIGLPPIDEPALKTVRQTVTSPAGPVSVYDFTSQGPNQTRLVVGLLSANGESWFLKMVGDAGSVSAARPDFLRWMKTLRFDAADE